MGMVDCISCPATQKAKITRKYDEEFAVATATRIRDLIVAIYIYSTPTGCQSQQINTNLNFK